MAKRAKSTVDVVTSGAVKIHPPVPEGSLCRKCGIAITDVAQVGSTNRDGKMTCNDCLGHVEPDLTVVKMNVIGPDMPVAIDPKNESAGMDHSDRGNPVIGADNRWANHPQIGMVPLEEQVTEAGEVPEANLETAAASAMSATKDKETAKRAARKEKPASAEKAAKADAATAEWNLITGLHAQGLDRSAIAKQTGISYSRLTFVLWHLKYEVGAIPGMPEYSTVKKAEAQKRYEADVAAKKAAAS